MDTGGRKVNFRFDWNWNFFIATWVTWDNYTRSIFSDFLPRPKISACGLARPFWHYGMRCNFGAPGIYLSPPPLLHNRELTITYGLLGNLEYNYTTIKLLSRPKLGVKIIVFLIKYVCLKTTICNHVYRKKQIWEYVVYNYWIGTIKKTALELNLCRMDEPSIHFYRFVY